MRNPIIQKRMEFFKTASEDMHVDKENNPLLQTIKIPKNLLFLTDRLPQANYDKPIKKSLSKKKTSNDNLPKRNESLKKVLSKEEKPEVDVKNQKDEVSEKQPEVSNQIEEKKINKPQIQASAQPQIQPKAKDSKLRIYKEEREKRQHGNKIHDIYSSNQELYPNIIRSGSYQDHHKM